jgi:predicted RNase H-like nuclease (RuvC/YqgF family)
MKTIKHRIEREKIEQADEIKQLKYECKSLETKVEDLKDTINRFYNGINALLHSGDTDLLKLATDDIKQLTTEEEAFLVSSYIHFNSLKNGVRFS